MSSSLSSLVDNLAVDIPPKDKDKKPKNIFSKECEKCKSKFIIRDLKIKLYLIKIFSFQRRI